MTELPLNRYGEPFLDYERDMIARNQVDDAACLLGFQFCQFCNVEAVACEICGTLLLASSKCMVRHRLRCMWDEA